MTNNKITVFPLRGRKQKAPLLHTYPGQSRPQAVYIELDLKNATLSSDWDGEIGNAVPMDVWHGHVQRFFISEYSSKKQINTLLQEVAPIAERVLAGYSSEWNGSNRVARFSAEAKNALAEIEEMCDDLTRAIEES